MDTDIMTLTEVADYLKLSESTIRRMLRREEIPAIKVGNQWRFLKHRIDEHLLQSSPAFQDSGFRFQDSGFRFQDSGHDEKADCRSLNPES